MQAPYSRTLADLIFEQAERYGERPAAIWRDQDNSYAELCRRPLCRRMLQPGHQGGERVGLLVSNRRNG
jgi:hypothetical protein